MAREARRGQPQHLPLLCAPRETRRWAPRQLPPHSVRGSSPLYKGRMGDLPKTDCGGCTVCCTALPIVEDFTKPAGVTCQHCTSSGCGIYATRYPICRTFVCGWLL